MGHPPTIPFLKTKLKPFDKLLYFNQKEKVLELAIFNEVEWGMLIPELPLKL